MLQVGGVGKQAQVGQRLLERGDDDLRRTAAVESLQPEQVVREAAARVVADVKP